MGCSAAGPAWVSCALPLILKPLTGNIVTWQGWQNCLKLASPTTYFTFTFQPFYYSGFPEGFHRIREINWEWDAPRGLKTSHFCSPPSQPLSGPGLREVAIAVLPVNFNQIEISTKSFYPFHPLRDMAVHSSSSPMKRG